MKHRPLVFQLWLFMAGIAALFGLVLLLVLPRLLGSFFTDEIFSTIESAQQERFPLIMERIRDQMIERELGLAPSPDFAESLPIPEEQNIRSVNHVIIQSDGIIRTPFELGLELEEMLRYGIETYIKDGNSRFSYPYQGKTLYLSVMYADEEMSADAQGMYLVSYMTNDYRDQLIDRLLSRILLLVALALLVAWIPALFLARILTKPLLMLRSHVQEYAKRALDTPVAVQRGDEIGELANSIEQMRVQLKAHDESQQSVLQNVSHELKTPVMVIQGYVQSVQDGMVQADRLPEVMARIEQEAARLEKRVGELLYLTKLDYLSKREVKVEQVRLHELVEAVAERMRWLKPELNWQLELAEVVVEVDLELWQVVLENMFDNQVRYANSEIRVEIVRSDDGVELSIWNDGPQFEAGEEQLIFEAFRKGTNGKFGLGLVIVRRIAELHAVEVSASNAETGVCFRFYFPCVTLAL